MEAKEITVLCFGVLAEKTGGATLKAPIHENVCKFRQWLLHTYPGLNSISFNVSINYKIASNEDTIPEGSEVALLPPYSGG
ncbi:MAG: MoaD/ThiS family protein [Cytophagaceae bacterium]|nr:MoaD/ThiS family protein [Cytophagaceae bacterium]MDW8456506.1 MoaD/ThiS family protein [Cytophagaceae bacterium]